MNDSTSCRDFDEYNSAISSNNRTNNPYARVLYFYYLYHRLKLTESDLTNIAKKYANNSTRLLHDLTAKYKGFCIPNEVHLSELFRICKLFTVPENYLRLLQLSLSTYDYDPRCDIYSGEFDAGHSLLLSLIHI